MGKWSKIKREKHEGDDNVVKVKLKMPDGKEVTGERMNFKIKELPETLIKLTDGTVLAMRYSIKDIFKIEGQFDPVTGEPLYFVHSMNVLRIAEAADFEIPKEK